MGARVTNLGEKITRDICCSTTKTRGGKKERPDGGQEDHGVAPHGKIDLVEVVVTEVVGMRGQKRNGWAVLRVFLK